MKPCLAPSKMGNTKGTAGGTTVRATNLTKAPEKSAMSRALRGGRGLIGSAVLFSFFTNLLLLTGPLFMLQVCDRVIGSRSEETLVALFGLVVFLYLFYTVLEFVRARVMARVGARLHANLSDRVFRRARSSRSSSSACRYRRRSSRAGSWWPNPSPCRHHHR